MSKKMCQHWMKKRRNFYGGHCDLNHNDCPKNTNSRCEIITKPKPRMVKIRAWADVSKEGILFGAFPDRFVFRAEKGGYARCTILIEAKHLKEAK